MSGLPEFEGKTSEDFRKIVVDGVFGSVDSIGLEIVIYSQQRIIDRALESQPIASNRMKIKRIAECELVLSPMQLKSTYLWLQKKIEEFEAIFGKIPSPEEIQNNAKKFQESQKSKNKNME